MAACHLTFRGWIRAWLAVLLLASSMNAEPTAPTDEPSGSSENIVDSVISQPSRSLDFITSSSKQIMITSTTFIPPLTPLKNNSTAVSSSSASSDATITDSASNHSVYTRTSPSSLSVNILPSISAELSRSVDASSKVVGTANASSLNSVLQSSPRASVTSYTLSTIMPTPTLTSYVSDNMNSTTSSAVRPVINSTTSGMLPGITYSASVNTSSVPGIIVSSSVNNKTIMSSLNVSSSSSSTSPRLFSSSTVANTSLPDIAVSTVISSVINKTVVSSVTVSKYFNTSSSLLSIMFSSSTVANFSSSVIVASSTLINKTMASTAVSKLRNISSSASVVSFSTGIKNASTTSVIIVPSMPVNVSSVTSTLQMSSTIAVFPTKPPIIAPSASPQNVTAYNTSSTSIFISWQPLPDNTLNGKLQKYEITVQTLETPLCQAGSASKSSVGILTPTTTVYNSVIIPSISVTTSPTAPVEPTDPPEPPEPLKNLLINAGFNLSMTVKDLYKFTCYEVRVRAVTSLNGPWSSPVAVKTDEDVPSQPLNVTVVDKNATLSVITWASPAELNGIVLGYRIKYGFSNASSTTKTATGDQFSMVLDGLRPYTLYTIQVAAFTRIGNGIFTSKKFKTLEAVPSSVRNLSGIAINSTTIKLSWMVPESQNGAIIYVVELKNIHKRREIPNTEFIATGLQAATKYTIRVYAKNIKHGFLSEAKEIIVPTLQSEPTAPPMDVHAITQSSSSILVKWFPPPPNSRHGIIIHYVVEYYKSTDKDTLLSNSTVDNTTSLTLVSLQPFTKYYIRAKAVNLAGPGVASEWVTNTTFEGAPSPPTNFTVRSANATSLLASWNHPDKLNGALVKYKLYSRQTSLNTTKDRLVYDGSDTMFLISGLHEFVSYTITLLAYNVKYGYHSTDVVAMETTHPSAPSGPPQDVQAITLSSHAIRVDWDPPKALDRNGVITGYILNYRSLQGANANHSVSGDQQSEVFSSLQPFTKYYFTVQAVNKVGIGPSSSQVQNMTLEDVPSPVIIDRVTNVSSTVLLISWLLPKHPNGYLLDFKICWHRIDVLNQTCQLVSGSQTSFNITGLEPSSSFNISISARTSVGYGPVVSSVYRTQAEGVPSEPLDLQVWNITATSLVLTWKPPKETNGVLTQYKVSYKRNDTSSVPSFITTNLNTEATLRSLHPFTLYAIYVQAATSQGSGPPASAMVTTDEGRPSGISSLGVHGTYSRYVSLKWDAPVFPNGRINYKLVYGPPGLSWKRTLYYNDTSADVQNLLPFTEYLFVVSAHNLKYGLNGAASNVTVTTMAEPPSGPPLNIKLLDLTSDAVTIAWDPPDFPNGQIKNYEIMLTEVDNNRPDSKTVDGGLHSIRLTKLLPWHAYVINIRCISSGGSGPASQNTFRTLPSVPPTVGPINPPNKDVITAHEIVIELKKASDSNGKISFYQVIVLELAKHENGTPVVPHKKPDDYKPNDLVTYFEAQRLKPKLLPYIAAQFPAKMFSNYQEFKVGNAKNFSVKARKRRDNTAQYYNGPLKPNTFYAMFQRAAVNKDIYTSTQWTEPVSTSESAGPKSRTHEASSTNAGLVAGLCVAFLIIIVIVIVVLTLMWKKKRFGFGMMLDDEGDYSNRSLKLKKIRGSKNRRRTSSRGLMGSTDSLDNLDDITRRRQPIPVDQFINHVRRMHIDGDIGFSEEYELVQPDDKEFTWHNSLLPYNKFKNRYANIVAYDHSRVLLTPVGDTQGSDYINANYIDGYTRSGAYIASQGPLQETFDDFWRMIWEQGTATIVMLTQLEERGRKKCDQYWPDRGTQTYGVIRVTASESSHMSYYILRTFILSHKQQEEEPRQVKQYHFTSWPDHGVPTHPVPLLSLVRTVSNANPSTAGPTVVHCSAGVGRTGTYITLDSTLQRIEREQTIDVFDFVQQMRMKRNLMVQTESQYVFIHDALVEAVSCGITEFEAKKFGSRLRELREVDPDNGRTYMEKEFLRLLKDERHHSTFKAANMGVNSAKNRYLNILPYEQTRVPLKMRPGDVGSDYINASYIDGYCRRNVYVATQAPLPSTFEDYWRMVWEQGSCVIVMLTKEEEAGKVKCHRYWPSDGTRIFDNVLVELTEEVEYPDYIMRQFNLTHTEEKDSRVVRQYQYTDWPDVGLPESGVGIIDLIGQVEKWQQQSSNSVITVHCSGGVGRTGVYCAISILIERVKAEGVIDVFQTVQSLRLQRPAMVQTLEQYDFCYSTLKEYLDSFDLYANFH